MELENTRTQRSCRSIPQGFTSIGIENRNISGVEDTVVHHVLFRTSFSSPEESDMPATSSKMSTDSQDIIKPPVEHENNRKRKAKNINLASAATNDEPSKKIKWNCGAHFSDQIEDPPNDSQSPVVTPQDQASASNPDRVPREKCVYGTRCYR